MESSLVQSKFTTVQFIPVQYNCTVRLRLFNLTKKNKVANKSRAHCCDSKLVVKWRERIIFNWFSV